MPEPISGSKATGLAQTNFNDRKMTPAPTSLTPSPNRVRSMTPSATGGAAVNPTPQVGGQPASTYVPQPGQGITGRPAGVPPLGVREDTTLHASLFIGDLSPEVNDATLRSAFGAFPSLSECRVMYDPNTGRSRGYGFASFRDAEDAHRALSTLNGEWLGSRPLRINWANQKNHSRHVNSLSLDGSTGPLTYEQILAASPTHNTTVYLGNLHPMTTQQDLVSLFHSIGFVREVRLQAEKGYGFAVLESHEAAATAIAQLGTVAGGPGVSLHGRVLRVSWGKDRNEAGHGSNHAHQVGWNTQMMPNLLGGGVMYGVGQNAALGSYPGAFGLTGATPFNAQAGQAATGLGGMPAFAHLNTNPSSLNAGGAPAGLPMSGVSQQASQGLLGAGGVPGAFGIGAQAYVGSAYSNNAFNSAASQGKTAGGDGSDQMQQH